MYTYWSGIRDTTNLQLCEQDGLAKGKHTLTVNATVTDPKAQVFWFDSIEYVSLDSGDLPVEGAMRVHSSDERSCFYHNSTGQWTDGKRTGKKGATMSFKFNGVWCLNLALFFR